MLDIKRIRENLEDIKKAMDRRGEKEFNLDEVVELDDKRKELLKEVEVLKNKMNVESKKIPQLIKEGKDITEDKANLKKLSDEIKSLDEKIKIVNDELEYKLLRIPNVPNKEVPQGETDEDNVEVRTWGEPTKFNFNPKAHWDLGTDLEILDFETAAKITGSRFTLYKGLGARLERALINFFLDTNIGEQGYTEVIPPFMANKNSFLGTGQLPKFAEDMFKIEGLDYYLIPTSEVPLTNIHANQILAFDELPKNYTAYTPCFRSEAGSAGRDTRGLVRQHQFNKVEMVKFTKPEQSYTELEAMTANAENILQKLGLPYHVIMLSTGDMGFSAAKTYDVEVWMPQQNVYREISSVSNTEDFQARRMHITYRDDNDKLQLVHTLNGSGLAVGRTVAAILENYQNEDGTVTIPEVLRPYMGGQEQLRATPHH